MKSHPLPGMQSSIRVGPSGGTVTEPPNKPPPPLPKKQPSYVNITKVSILSININVQLSVELNDGKQAFIKFKFTANSVSFP